MKFIQSRKITIIFLFLIVPIGFYTKFYSGPAHVWVNNSFGGLLYEIFWCLVFFFLFPKTKPFKIALWVLLVTCSLEFLQLWHPPFLEYLRENFIGRTILGNSFNRNDFPYYFAGSLMGYYVLILIKRITEGSNSSENL
jgi:hypothetical protein